MTTELAIVRAQAQTLGGTQDITSSSITDFSAAIGFIFGHGGDGGSPTGHARMGVGICVEDAQSAGVAVAACTSVRDRNSQTTTSSRTEACGNIASPTRFLSVVNTASNATVAACDAVDRVTSGIANGVRLNWTTTPDQAYEMVFVLIGGLSNQSIQPIAATTTPGFQTDFAVILSTSGSFSGGNGSFALDAQPNLGFLVRTALAQVCACTEWNSAVTTTDADTAVRTARAAGQVIGGVESDLQCTAIGATTVTFTVNSVAGHGLFCKFADASSAGVAVETIPSGTGVTAFTGLGFAPALVIGVASGITASDSLTDGVGAASAGFFTSLIGDGEYSGTIRQKEGLVLGGAVVTETSTLFETKALLLMDTDGAVATRATRDVNTGTGFQLNFSSAGSGRMALLGLSPAQITSVVPTETEQIADSPIVNLISRRILSETEQISDGIGGMVLTMGVTTAGPNGAVFQGGAVRGQVFQGSPEAGVVADDA